jgi:5-(hydroxymethyl)furfural/furfural oxidase
MNATHVVIGGGTAGCVLAARLTENPNNRVILLEAGPDFLPDNTPPDILDSYAGYAWVNPDYYWEGLKARRGDLPGISAKALRAAAYEQARVIGGGSSINGQVSLRGAPEDYDRWEKIGANGWDWRSVLPYFRKLERDLDFVDQLHGSAGPITIRRIPREDWDRFTCAVARVWEHQGYAFVPDLNGAFEVGYGPLPVSNDGQRRVSSAIGYLDGATRARPNLEIRADTSARRLVFDGARAVGIELGDDPAREVIAGSTFVLAAGAIYSPTLLMRSGIGPGAHLQECGIPVLLDRPGVGANLQDHPAIAISAYLAREARPAKVQRRNYAYLRFSSGEADCRTGDMIMMAICRSAWHAIGSRLGTLGTYIGQTFSRGSVRLSSPKLTDPPDICLNLLADLRDRRRAVEAFRRMAEILVSDPVARLASAPFPSTLSDRVKKIGRRTWRNAVLTTVAAGLMDSSAPLRRLLINNVITDGVSLAAVLNDEHALEKLVCESAVSCYHVSGTCRMGPRDDPMSVTDSGARVIGLENVYVADASIMPEVSRHNTALPTMMIAEKISDLLA